MQRSYSLDAGGQQRNLLAQCHQLSDGEQLTDKVVMLTHLLLN